ncbi:MAG: type II secretion system inner membrane protein GspF [Gammaproteobacteria bacterium]|nr:type II secretion system inner membrane protein GspF [Gammaproteobacteria bacterium]
MSAFEFSALDSTGRTHKGVLEGDTARQIRGQLRDKGWTPLVVEEVQQREARSGGFSFTFARGINSTDLALMTRQLATLVHSALPVEEAVRAVSQQTEKLRLRNMLMAVRSRVLEGHSLATALADFPHIFPELYRATVAAGEQSGHLNVVLERLADYTETRQQLRQKVQLALIYPVIVTLVAIGVVVALLAFVVPQVVQVFENVGQKLPLLTRALIALSDFIRSYGVVLLLAAGAAGVAAVVLLKREPVRYRFHQVLLQLPLLGRLVRGLNAARFARTFSILTASSVPVLEGLKISASVLSNLPLRAAVNEAATRVREGSSLHTALEHTHYFPPMLIHLIASGEASGKLDSMLERAAVSQEREMETLIAALLGLFEPALILGMGLMVVLIVVAILLPIFDLNQLVK